MLGAFYCRILHIMLCVCLQRDDQRECGGLFLTALWLDEVSSRLSPHQDSTRSFQGDMPSLGQFFANVRAGQVSVLGARDFGYNGDIRRVGFATLEREVWLLDDTCAIDADRAFVVLHVHTATKWDPKWKGDTQLCNHDWSKVTQINIRHSCRTVPFSTDNLTIGQAFGRVAKSGKSKQKLVFGPNQVDSKHKCRWTERSDLSVAILSCKQPQGRVLKTGRRNRVEEWEDSIGTKWIRAQSGDAVGAAAESEDAFNPNERVHWHDEYGKPYDGPRNYRGLPEPKCAGGASHAGRGIEPWQWQKPKSKMGVIVDPQGKIAQDLSHFLAGLQLGQAQNWEE